MGHITQKAVDEPAQEEGLQRTREPTWPCHLQAHQEHEARQICSE